MGRERGKMWVGRGYYVGREGVLCGQGGGIMWAGVHYMDQMANRAISRLTGLRPYTGVCVCGGRIPRIPPLPRKY